MWWLKKNEVNDILVQPDWHHTRCSNASSRQLVECCQATSYLSHCIGRAIAHRLFFKDLPESVCFSTSQKEQMYGITGLPLSKSMSAMDHPRSTSLASIANYSKTESTRADFTWKVPSPDAGYVRLQACHCSWQSRSKRNAHQCTKKAGHVVRQQQRWGYLNEKRSATTSEQ